VCETVGLPELATDPRFATNEARVANVDAFADALNAVLRERPAEHWVAALQAASVPVGIVNEVDEAFALADRLGMEPTEERDGLPLVRPPLRLDGERPPIRLPPPRLDEHGDDLRDWLSNSG
jgi:crotonobetainyl-CoA:carnitine CoA-transferase CaiB-like acyl-CoA transferase